ncbi:MAG: thioredoxin [Candidatus Aegiribacteria sp.]|nr:thioredoxin [Candidatus Aegiribacteria sp.]
MAVKQIKGNEIEDAASSKDKIALIDFGAPWCGPCKMIEPVLETLSDEMNDKVSFYTVNVDENPSESSRYGIRGVPTLIAFHDGNEVDRMVGYRDADSLKIQLSELAQSKLTL